MAEYTTFWLNFSRICMERGLKPTYVATKIGYSASAATRWKSSRNPQGETILKLSEFLGVSPDAFFADPTLPSTTKPKVELKLSFEDALVESFKALPLEAKAKLLAYYTEKLSK